MLYWSVDLVKYKISHACRDGSSDSEAMIDITGSRSGVVHIETP